MFQCVTVSAVIIMITFLIECKDSEVISMLLESPCIEIEKRSPLNLISLQELDLCPMSPEKKMYSKYCTFVSCSIDNIYILSMVVAICILIFRHLVKTAMCYV